MAHAPSALWGARMLARPRVTLMVGTVLLLWVILVFNPHWFLLARGLPRIVLRVQFATMVTLAALLVIALLDRGRLKTTWPLMAYAGFVALYAAPNAYDPLLSVPESKLAQVTVLMAIASLTLVRHAAHVRAIVLMMLLYRFAWFGLIGLPFGNVRFDPSYGNSDAFGSLMAMGVVAAASVAIAATDSRTRKIGAAVALISVGGLVSSFARGAFLVGAFAIAFLWFRMDGRRLALGVFIAVAAITTVVVGSAVSGAGRGRAMAGSWFAELSTVSEDIADSDAEDRRLIWRIGWQVFRDHPLTGVGPSNWSVYASENYSGPILGERFSQRPERLWGRAMHNIYVQSLADLGLIGSILFLALLVDYWRRILAIRRGVSNSDASVLPGLRTKAIATGFEVSMVAHLGAGMLYNVLDWSFFALVIANTLFHQAWVGQARSGPARSRRRVPVRHGLPSR